MRSIQQAAEKRKVFAERIGKLRSQLQFEEQKASRFGVEGQIKALEGERNELKKFKRKQQEVDIVIQIARQSYPRGWTNLQCKRRVQIEASQEQYVKEITGLEEQASGLRSRLEKIDSEMDSMKEQVQTSTKTGTRVHKEISKLQGLIENLIENSKEIVSECKVEQLSIPGIDLNKEYLDSTENQEDVQILEGYDTNSLQYFYGLLTRRIIKFFHLYRVDYSGLDRKYSKSMNTEGRTKTEAEFKEKISELREEIQRLAPNLKAMDQYDALKVSIRDVAATAELRTV